MCATGNGAVGLLGIFAFFYADASGVVVSWSFLTFDCFVRSVEGGWVRGGDVSMTAMGAPRHLCIRYHDVQSLARS